MVITDRQRLIEITLLVAVLISPNIPSSGATNIVVTNNMYALRYQAAKFNGVQLGSYQLSSLLRCAALCKHLQCQSFNFGCFANRSSDCLCTVYENVVPNLEANNFEASEYLNYYEMSRFKKVSRIISLLFFILSYVCPKHYSHHFKAKMSTWRLYERCYLRRTFAQS